MNSRFAMNLSAAVVLGSTSSAAMAYNLAGNTDIRTGFGDEIVVHHGLFGSKETLAKDRLGDGYINKHGPLGTSEKGFNLLGNTYVKKKGLIGGTQVEASSIFGDRMESKKSLFGLGRRQTNVDLSGVSSIVQGVFANRHLINSGMGQPGPTPPDTMPTATPDVRPNWSPANIPNNSLDQAAGLAPQPTP